MKLRIAILILCVCGNVLLALKLARRDTASASMVAPQVQAIPRGADASAQTTLTAPPAELLTPVEPARFDWAQLESSDYVQYVENLRAFGVPERVVRDIIIADVDKQYRPRRAALRPDPRPQNDRFWERTMFGFQPQPSKEQREQLRALQKEEFQLLKTLLGEDYPEQMAEEAGSHWVDERYAGVPRELRETVQDIMSRMAEATQDIYAESQGRFDQYDQEELRYVKRKFHDELAAILTPEQLLELELRTSDTAQQMKQELGFFEPTEEEFRTIFQNKQALEDLSPPRDPDEDPPQLTSEERKLLQQRSKELNDALVEALGEDRAGDYKLVTQWEYRQLLEAGVDKVAVRQLPDIQNQAQAAVSTIRKDATLTPEERSAALEAIQAETQSTLNSLLGEKQARNYANNGGYWIRNLAPPQARP